MDIEHLQFPIGRFERPINILNDHIIGWIDEIEELPSLLRDSISGFTKTQLVTAYRPGGWTVKQVIHHMADSHINSYIRFKLALLNPTL